ncbi:protein SSUH2 homolog [Lingula anatina]|uniref:Protein SSUH2 homolog n=1 Tax=Lingula anatina TaxID=7574 RepID=A0A1S3KDP4_LINAN|nr:protein SSUH2 homolog [Lingula anatina]|eukprot:XP_013420748.1 protein SSUH2 homolog [Lingula anatina]
MDNLNSGSPTAGYQHQVRFQDGENIPWSPKFKPSLAELQSVLHTTESENEHYVPHPSQFEKFRGYEYVPHVEDDAYAATVPPPKFIDIVGSREKPKEEYGGNSVIKEEDAKQALLDHCRQHKCYGKSAAQEMKITNFALSSALHYKLETFTEKRTVKWELEPYRGEIVDTEEDGYPPSPWEVQIHPSAMFQRETKTAVVPFTTSIKDCFLCHGRGWTPCRLCHGHGHNKCFYCHGTGHTTKTDFNGHQLREHCNQCGGSGKDSCSKCHEDGCFKCHRCDGYKKMKQFIQIKAEFANHKSDYILERTKMPEKLGVEVQGFIIFEQTSPRVWPISQFPERELCRNSQRLCDEHNAKFQDATILMQRHQLQSVPVSQWKYEWNGGEYSFWVYGNDRKVYAPDYPQKCCWCCQIL